MSSSNNYTYLSTVLIQSEELRETLANTLNLLQRIMPTSGGHSIILWDDEQQRFTEGATTVQKQPDGSVERRVRREGGASRWIIDNHQPLVAHSKSDPFGANPMLDEYQIHSYLGVPLIHKDTAIGVVYALSRVPYEYSNEEINTLQDFGQFITTTIVNVQLTQTLFEVNQSLQQERNQLEAIFNTIPEILYIKDTEGRFQNINQWSVNYYDVDTRQDIIGTTDRDFWSSEHAEVFEQEDAYVIATGNPIINKEHHIKNGKHGEEWLLTTKFPVNDAHGNIIGIVGSTHIVSELKLAEKQEQDLKTKELQVKLLQNFIGSMAHDLRTPLSIMNTSVYIMQKRHSDILGERLQLCSNQVQRLTLLVDDMIMMVQLDVLEQLTLLPKPLLPIIEKALEKLSPLAHNKNQSLSMIATEELPQVNIASDELSLAIQQLVENAIMHNPSGTEIKLITELSEDNVMIRVMDTGIGIDAEHLKYLFDHTYRIDNARRSDTGGTGLGLTMVRKIINLHHGFINVISEVGHGTEFQIILPLANTHRNMLD